jgi:predicted PurR-regulated permease PerM
MNAPASASAPLRLLVIALATVAAAVLVTFAFRYLLVVFAGVLFAVFLHAVSDWTARRVHLPYGVMLVAVLLLGGALLAVAVISLVPTVAEQVDELRHQLPQAIAKLRERLQHLPLLPPSTSHPKPLEPGQALGPALSALGGSIEVLGGLVVVFFLGVYGAAQPDLYSRVALALTPRGYEARMSRTLSAVSASLSRWLVGRFVAMLFVGIASGIGFQLLHVQAALALGMFAGALTFIEYAGAVISAIPPILFALATSPTAALGVAILFTVLHVIEGYVLTPLLARASVHLPPGVTLACQVVLGALAGPLGLTYSTPLLVVCVSATQAWRAQPGDSSEHS